MSISNSDALEMIAKLKSHTGEAAIGLEDEPDKGIEYREVVPLETVLKIISEQTENGI